MSFYLYHYSALNDSLGTLFYSFFLPIHFVVLILNTTKRKTANKSEQMKFYTQKPFLLPHNYATFFINVSKS